MGSRWPVGYLREGIMGTYDSNVMKEDVDGL